MRWLELKIPPLLLVLLFAAAMWGVAKLAPGWSFPLMGGSLVALALVAAGLVVTAAGVRAFRRHQTTLNPMTPGEASAIVTGGAYRHTRNPMYLGFLLVLFGWAAYLSNAGAVLLLPVFVAYMTRFQVKPEERALQALFGAEYLAYMARVRRWL